jgi:hypothetical protein
VSGYRADIAWSEKYKIGIAVLMNVEGSSISEITTKFWQMAFDMLEPQTLPKGRVLASSKTASP